MFTGPIIKDIRTITRGVEMGRKLGRAGVVGKSRGKRQKTVLEQQ